MDQFLRPASETGFLEIWLPPVSNLSLSLPLPPSPFQAEFPSRAWRLSESTYLPWLLRSALASKIHMRGSLRWGTLRYSSGCQWPNVDSASSLSWNFISFPCKPSYSASFLH